MRCVGLQRHAVDESLLCWLLSNAQALLEERRAQQQAHQFILYKSTGKQITQEYYHFHHVARDQKHHG